MKQKKAKAKGKSKKQDQAQELENFKREYRVKTLQLSGASGDTRLGIGLQLGLLLTHYAGFLTGKNLE